MIGLADCNNFFVSCERAFRPDLKECPVVVLSNNDGCVISRSNEAKALGIPMGAPFYQVKPLVQSAGVKVFSGNMELYSDLSHRVMRILSQEIPRTEIYSVDECFLDFEGYCPPDWQAYGRRVVALVEQGTGIPISIGLANTKTLAKLASKQAKHDRIGTGGCFLIDDEQQREAILRQTEISEVWGIGRKYSKFLKDRAIPDAYTFCSMSASWVKQYLKLPGWRTWRELQGFRAIEHDIDSEQQSICVSRSFGHAVTELDEMESILASFVAQLGRKLRAQDGATRTVIVFIQTNYFRKDLPQYSEHTTVELPLATNHTPELLRHAMEGLRRIFRPHYHYKRAGIMVVDLCQAGEMQANLFYDYDQTKNTKLMHAVDKINRQFGQNAVHSAVQDIRGEQISKSNFRSPRYSTRPEDVLKVRIT